MLLLIADKRSILQLKNKKNKKNDEIVNVNTVQMLL